MLKQKSWEVKYILMSKLIQKHFGKIALGTGLGLGGVFQFFGETLQKDAVKMGNDFMDAFAADLKQELDSEIQKFRQRIATGAKDQDLMKDAEKEAVHVEQDLAKAFHKDVNITIEKEVLRISKRILHDYS